MNRTVAHYPAHAVLHWLMPRAKRCCPRCGSKDIARLIFGLITPDVAERYRKKDVIFGGCGVPPAEPRWECRSCGFRFGGKAVG
jgi:hypothetical protein